MKKNKEKLKKRIQKVKNFPKFFRKCAKYCPLMKKILFSGRNEYPVQKALGGFLFGVIIAMLFYKFIIRELAFDPITTVVLTGIILLLLSVGCAVSSQLRCSCLLTVPAFFGKAGRGALKALVITFLIAGPVQNLTANTKEVIRSFACSLTLTYNLTKTRFVLMFKPFKDSLMSIKVNTHEIKDSLNTIRDVAAPIVTEFTDMEEVKYIKETNDYLDEIAEHKHEVSKRSVESDTEHIKNVEHNYFKKLETRCDGVFAAADSKCRKIFRKTEDECYETLHWSISYLVCWVMKLDFICGVVDLLGGRSTCDATKEISPGFGEGYVYLANSRKMLVTEFKATKIQYQILKPNFKLNIRGAADTAKAITKEFQEKKTIFDRFTILVKRILALVFIKIIVQAQQYHDGYLESIQFNNVYITKYFRKIDARRRQLGKHTLLPLKKTEKPGYIDPHSYHLFPKEKKHLTVQAFKIILEMFTVTSIILIDRLYYETLDLIRRHGKIEYHQFGIHDLTLIVKGTGLVANVVRSILKHFNFRKRIEERYTNQYCLPRPRLLKNSYLRKIYGTYIVILLMLILEGYAQRCRRLICAFFYPKREKKRVLHLYNDILKQRIGFYKYMKKRLRRMIRENKLPQDNSYLLMLRLKFPKFFGWLRWFKDAKKRCLICGEHESKKAGKIECPTCLYMYCLECWSDIDKQCFVCNPSSEDDASDEEPIPADD